jgi:hypothetical protein
MKYIYILCILIAFQKSIAQNRDSLKNLVENTNGNKADAMANNMPGAALPIFNILQFDSIKYNTALIDPNKSAVLMLFNPNCEHCMDETKAILANLHLFPNTQFVLIAGDQTFPYFPNFIRVTGFKKNPQVVLGVDLDYITPTIFAYEGIPQIMIYGKDKKLIDVLYKDVPVQKIVNVLNREGQITPRQIAKPKKKSIIKKIFRKK